MGAVRITSLPRWAAVLVGGLALLSGGALVFHPFASLAVLLALVVLSLILLAIGELSSAPSTSDSRISRARSAGWLLAALVIVLWPGLSVGGLAIVVGVLLVLDGCTDIVGAIRARRDERVAAFDAQPVGEEGAEQEPLQRNRMDAPVLAHDAAEARVDLEARDGQPQAGAAQRLRAGATG